MNYELADKHNRSLPWSMKHRIVFAIVVFMMTILMLGFIENKAYAYTSDAEVIQIAKEYSVNYEYVSLFYRTDNSYLMIYSNKELYVYHYNDSYNYLSLKAFYNQGETVQQIKGLYAPSGQTFGNEFVVSGNEQNVGDYSKVTCIYSSYDLYETVNPTIVQEPLTLYHSAKTGNTNTFISIAQSLNLEMEYTDDCFIYDKMYRHGNVVIISSEKENCYSILSAPEPMLCKKVNRLIFSDYYKMSGKIRHRYEKTGEEMDIKGEYDDEYHSTEMNNTSEIIYTSYDIYDEDGVLIKAKNMEVPKFEPIQEYKGDMLRLYDGTIIQKEGTEDTYIVDWLYHEMGEELYNVEFEISAMSTIEGYQKLTDIKNYKDILSEYGYSGVDGQANFAQKSEYEFDISDLASEIAIKTWSSESVTSVIPDAIYIRPMTFKLYDNKAYEGDWLKIAFTWDGDKIVKADMTDISNIKDNDDGTITETTASNANSYNIDYVKTGLDALDQYYQDHNNEDVLSNVKTTLGQVPALVSALFSFIPAECIALLSLAITFIVALMIKRAIL